MNLSKLALFTLSSLTLASFGCSAPAERGEDATTDDDEAALTSSAGRIVAAGDWKLSHVRFVSQGSQTLSTSDEGSGRVTFRFEGAQPTVAAIQQIDDGFLFTPVRVSFRAPGVAGGGTRKIAADAMCNQTLLVTRPGWQSGIVCRLTNDKDQRGESWIVKVVFDDEGVVDELTVAAQHRPTFDRMIGFVGR